ncbi:hypothetical protein PG993_002991 [Apiospora rasikravindrae]|uniref:Uncharacterized protein n=1 Tax=Apiospora rasikravindrae TaxID=990691 RepID=A0ABR1U0E3_9PEZI
MSNEAQQRYLVISDSDNVDIDLINDAVLSNGKLVLPAKPDLSEILTAEDRPIGSYASPFINLDEDGEGQARETMRQSMARDNMASTKAYAVLDSHSAEDRTTCYVSSFEYDNRTKEDNGDEDEEESTSNVNIRCNLDSVVPLLEALEAAEDSTAARVLRNEAAAVGGVWDAEKVQTLRNQPSKLRSAKWKPSPAWDEDCAMEGRGETAHPYLPVFRTADISLETIQGFVKEASSKANSGDDDEEEDGDEVQPVVAFITSLRSPFFDQPGLEPPVAKPALADELLGLSAGEVDMVVRSAFPKQNFENVKLHYNAFIIMDEHTEATQSVILATNSEFGGELQLVRCVFATALESVLGIQETGLCMDTMANEAPSDNGTAIMQSSD